MRLNSHKTNYSNNIIQDSIKSDKYYVAVNQKSSRKIDEELLIISALGNKFPNS